MELKEIQEYVKKQLSEKRYNHSVGVMERSEELAKMYGADVEIAKKIGIAHDVAKEISEEDKLKYVKDNNIEIDEVERENTPLLHAKIGKDIAIKKFGFSESMGQAIANHTTGNKDMDIYSKILFIADRTSKERNFDDIEYIKDFQPFFISLYQQAQGFSTFLPADMIYFTLLSRKARQNAFLSCQTIILTFLQ